MFKHRISKKVAHLLSHVTIKLGNRTGLTQRADQVQGSNLSVKIPQSLWVVGAGKGTRQHRNHFKSSNKFQKGKGQTPPKKTGKATKRLEMKKQHGAR